MLLDWIILILAIPSGYLIAWLARDELIQGRFWFKVLIYLSLIIGVIFYFLERFYISLTMGFIIVVSAISLRKSYDKKWVKKV